jgi:hypothetical protein
MKTTDLLQLNLTDFLDEVNQVNKRITTTDLNNYVESITNDYDAKKVYTLLQDIAETEPDYFENNNLRKIVGMGIDILVPKMIRRAIDVVREKGHDISILEDFKRDCLAKLPELTPVSFVENLCVFANELPTILPQQQLTIPDTLIPEKNRQKKPHHLHFTQSFISTERQNLFNELVSGGFFSFFSVYSHFCYVFGGTSIP